MVLVVLAREGQVSLKVAGENDVAAISPSGERGRGSLRSKQSLQARRGSLVSFPGFEVSKHLRSKDGEGWVAGWLKEHCDVLE